MRKNAKIAPNWRVNSLTIQNKFPTHLPMKPSGLIHLNANAETTHELIQTQSWCWNSHLVTTGLIKLRNTWYLINISDLIGATCWLCGDSSSEIIPPAFSPSLHCSSHLTLQINKDFIVYPAMCLMVNINTSHPLADRGGHVCGRVRMHILMHDEKRVSKPH